MRLALFLTFAIIAPSGAHAWWSKAEPVNCSELYAETYGLTKRETQQLGETGDIFSLPRPILGQAEELNQVALQKMKSEPLPGKKGTRRKSEFTVPEMSKLFDDIQANPQVSETILCDDRYKNSERRGFCFARSIAAHLKALQAGINNKSVRKLWAVGRLEMDGETWNYHVTTAVRVKGGDWYALDPTFAKPMPIEDWYVKMRDEYDLSKTMRLFSTPAKQFGLSSPRKYSQEHFSRDLYNGFFLDLLATIRRENRPRGELRPLQPSAREKEFAKKWIAGGAGVSAAGLYGLYRIFGEKN